ncbi:MAG: hypothetical protein ABIE70_08125 [bacterium]
MAKKQSFADKASKRSHSMTCPVCQEQVQYVKYMKAVKGDNGAWKMRPQNVGICKCNEAEVYG